MSNANGALTGIVLAATAHWARYDDDTQRRLRNVRDDAEAALEECKRMQGHGDVIRSHLPVLMDAQVGIALATAQPTSPSVLPSTVPLSRPDLQASMEVAIEDMQWPPEPGEYDERGMVKRAGELTPMFLAQTYEEVRAFVQGLAQTRSPTKEAKLQVWNAANALVGQLATQRLTWQQYKDAWARLFGGGVGGNSGDAHRDPARGPSFIASNNAVATLVPLSSLTLPGYPWANRQTDVGMRVRITALVNVNPGTNLGLVAFGSEYRYSDGVPFQPVVQSYTIGVNKIVVDGITSTGFTLSNQAQITAGQFVDVHIATGSGC